MILAGQDQRIVVEHLCVPYPACLLVLALYLPLEGWASLDQTPGCHSEVLAAAVGSAVIDWPPELVQQALAAESVHLSDLVSASVAWKLEEACSFADWPEFGGWEAGGSSAE